MISGHGCIRAHKMGLALLERGHNVHFIAMSLCNFHEQYKSFALACDVEQLLHTVRAYAGIADVFHVHNEPSWFVTAVKETCSVPVILDVHDSYLARSTPAQADAKLEAGVAHVRITTEERNNFQLADALVFPGERFRDTVSSEYGLRQPAIVIPSAVPERFYQYKTLDWHGGLVYEGKVNTPAECKGASEFFRYCDYTELAEQATAMGLDFHLYAGRSGKEFRKAYEFDKCFVHEPQHFPDLLKVISRHDWGLVGNVYPTPEWDAAMPNKLFEYMAAGVPVVAMNAADCAEFIREHDIGIVVESLAELGQRWSEHREKRANVLRLRKQFSMNRYVERLEVFYDIAIHAPGLVDIFGLGNARNDQQRRGMQDAVRSIMDARPSNMRQARPAFDEAAKGSPATPGGVSMYQGEQQ